MFASQLQAQDVTLTDTAFQAEVTILDSGISIIDTAVNPIQFYPCIQPKIYPYHHNRIKWVAGGSIAGYGAGMIGLYSAWYKNYPQTTFHFFNDNKEWLQVDKVGHAFSAYSESYASMELWRWTGVNKKTRLLAAGLSGAGYQTIIETLDGFSAGWGWSWGDFAANIFGSGLLVGQEMAWDEQRIRLKYSFHPKKYGSPDLDARSAELFGSGIQERFLKDYNAHTFWMSANLKSFAPKSNLPCWLNIAFGYGAEGLFGGHENIGTDDHGNINFDRRDIKRYRQFYLAPDIDFNKIKTNSKLLRFVLGGLNVLKFPTPSLEFSNGSFKWNWLHF